MGDHRPALPVIGRFGNLLRKAGERNPVNGQPPGGVSDRLDPAPIGPAAQGVTADPEKVRSLPDPKRPHQGDLNADTDYRTRRRCIRANHAPQQVHLRSSDR
jgi:hypothetical protein